MTRAIALVLLIAATAAPAGPSAAADGEWIATGEIRRGMRGIARTVVRGTTVEAFDVEALAVLPRGGPAGDLILIRVSGPLIQQTGGIAAGMSGSPVYLNGRLAGAIGFGWSFADHRLGLATSIADMMRVLPSPRAQVPPLQHPGALASRALAYPITIGGRTLRDIVIVPTAAAARAFDARFGTASFVPLAPPLLLSGLSPRAAQMLRTELEPLGVTAMDAATGASSDIRPLLVPGSAIGVQLMRGDVNAVAIGTLTYRQGDALVGFGHQFLNRGRTAYLLTPAAIHEVVRSTLFPFKVGSAGAPVGVISEDRRSGIGGRVGVMPPLVVIRATVVDRDRNRTITLGTRVVRDRQLGPLLALTATLDAVDRALDRVGEGTARVRLILRGRGLDAPLVRENVFYHPRDIATAALIELPEALRLLFTNEFVRTGPIDVTVEAEVDSRRQTAAITEALPERPRARRGETLVVRVTLRPFQGEPLTRTVEIGVPEGFPAGQATLLVRAGGRPAPEQGLASLLVTDPVEQPATSAAAQVATFAERDRNTDLIVELIPGAARFPGSAGESSIQPAKARIETSWVVRGRLQIPVTVDAQ